jgi:hypothetical protein
VSALSLLAMSHKTAALTLSSDRWHTFQQHDEVPAGRELLTTALILDLAAQGAVVEVSVRLQKTTGNLKEYSLSQKSLLCRDQLDEEWFPMLPQP